MYAITTHTGREVKFLTFAKAADFAAVHARKWQEGIQLRRAFSGNLLADFAFMPDNTVSVIGISLDGRALVEAWAA